MKRILLFTFVAMLAVVGCQKSTLEQKQENIEQGTTTTINNVVFKVVNNTLSFNTPDEYQKAIDYVASLKNDQLDTWEKNIGFASMRTDYAKKQQAAKCPVPDVTFASLLNPNGKIMIGNYTFTVNSADQIVNVIDNKNSTKATMSFSFEQDVLSTLFENKNNLKNADNVNATCGNCNKEIKPTFPNANHAYVCQNRYYKAGIYFSLFCEFDAENTFYWNIFMDVTYSWDNGNTTNASTVNLSGYQDDFYLSVYHSWRYLRDYSCTAKYYIQSDSDTYILKNICTSTGCN